ncbi:N6-adenine methyltransferase [Aureococcus anophagefferens]|nr:N6-adenine methyltransferase [Aureococcus anophagefferens]
MERGRPAHAKACCLSALLFGALRFAAAAPADSTLRYVSDARDADAVDAFLRGAVDAAPVVAWTAESYHYETTSRGSGDDRRTSTRRVVTAVARETSLAFDDAATADEYAAALADFARRHRRRDVHLSLEQDFSFKGWDEDERILGIRRPLGAPGALWSPAGFWAAAGLGLTVPYRLAFERKCAVASLDVAKRVRSAPHVAREADPVI